jgi:hypothetical protein
MYSVAAWDIFKSNSVLQFPAETKILWEIWKLFQFLKHIPVLSSVSVFLQQFFCDILDFKHSFCDNPIYFIQYSALILYYIYICTVISVSDIRVWMGKDSMWNNVSESSHSAVRPQPTLDTENLWTCDWHWARSLVTEPVLRETPPPEEILCPSVQLRDPSAGNNAVLPRCQTPNRGRDPVSFPGTWQSLSSPPAIKTDYLDT